MKKQKERGLLMLHGKRTTKEDNLRKEQDWNIIILFILLSAEG